MIGGKIIASSLQKVREAAARLRPGPRYVYKSSITGEFVSKAFYEANPTTTYRMEIKR